MSGILSAFIGRVAGVVTDAYFNLVTLLLPGNGTNGAQNNTFLDSSTNNFTITRNGNTTQGTFSPFSHTGWSNHFNGATTSGPFISASYSTTNFDWFTSGQDFTLECWVFPADLATFSYSDGTNIVPRMTGNADVGGTINYWSFGPISDGKVRLHYFNGATVQVTSTSTVTANTWNHIAFTKTSSGIIIFVNGTATTATAVSGTPQSSASYPLVIGRINNASINGYVSNYRILKNVTPPYSGSYTVPTLPLTDISGTKILTAQANRFIDSSSVANALTVSGSTISVQAFSPFAPTAAYSAATVGGSGYFDGTGDSLVTPSITIGTNAFCFECWIYPTVTQNNPGPGLLVATTSNGLQLSYYQATGLGIAIKGVAWQITSTGLPIVGQWNHVAFVRSGTGTNQTSIFLNGTRVANGTVSTNYSAAAYSVSILDVDFSPFLGYVSGARLTNGSTPYDATQSTITIPTAPPTTSASNTTLLLNFTNAGITDATAKNDLETVGNAQISTTQSKFGGSSIAFDGTGDYLTFPASQNWVFGTGDFTIEFWIYANSLASTAIFIECRNNTVGPVIFYDSGALRVNFNSVGGTLITGGSLSTATWHHIALSRSGSSTRLFVNGTQSGSTATDTNNYSNNTLIIGASYLATQTLNGYIDDLRISKYARYTANFTAPTSAFALQ